MENLLSVLGTLFFLFLVLSAAVEVILEIFRGTLERFGVTWAKSKITLEDALKLASEFGINSAALNTKLEAVKATAMQIQSSVQDKIVTLADIKSRLANVGEGATTDALAAELNNVANQIKAALESSDRLKVFILRTTAAIVGCGLVWASDFYVFQILSSLPEATAFATALQKLNKDFFNIVVGGLAAAAGSSFWHDQIDRVRNLKAVVTETKKLTS